MRACDPATLHPGIGPVSDGMKRLYHKLWNVEHFSRRFLLWTIIDFFAVAYLTMVLTLLLVEAINNRQAGQAPEVMNEWGSIQRGNDHA